MASVINTNIPSLNAQRNLSTSQMSLNTSLQRLSSGLRINSAKDDAAGLAISERFTSQIRGMDQARRNSNDGVSLAQTGEGALSQMGDILQRVRELAVQSANATNSASDRQAMNAEVGQLVSELDRFANTTDFNGTKLFDGSISSSVFQVGANANQTITATTRNLRTTQYGSYQVGSSAHVSGTAARATYTLSGAGTAGGHLSGAVVTASGTFDVRGAAGTATLSGVTRDTAKSLADKINAAVSKTGVTATATNTVALKFSGTTAANGSGAYTFQLLGNQSQEVPSSISFNLTKNTDGTINLAQAVSAFNDKSAQTNVTARLADDGKSLLLTNADGGDITLKSISSATGAVISAGYIASGTGAFTSDAIGGLSTANSARTFGGQLTLNSASSFSIVSSTAAFQVGVIAAASLAAAGTTTSELKKVSDLDVSSVEKANQTIRTVDGAITAINDQRAKYGALQSRFDASISNLQTSAENLSAARSRIRDTDFAAETASLTRSQILQQAGTAMLAQANSLPNQVLTLLRG